MLRRFLVFTIALFALFLLACWGQHKFAEQFQIFPQLESLYPPDPLLTFKRAFADLGTKKQDSEPQIPAAETAELSEQQQPGEESDRPILASGDGFTYLVPFFDRLERLEKSRRSGESDVLRILHFGDSIMWGDNLSIKMKDLFQSDFGDGGRGLVNIIDSPSSALQEHKNDTRRGFRVKTIPFESFTIPLTPFLGFSGGAAQPLIASAQTVHSIPEEKFSPWTNVTVLFGNASRLSDTWKSNGTLEEQTYSAHVFSEDSNKNYDATATVKGSCESVNLPIDPTRKLKISFDAAQAPAPLIDGLFLETNSGVSYSAIVKMGIHLAWMLMVPEKVFECGMRKTDPALVIFQYGVNESASLGSHYQGFTKEKYEDQLRQYFRRVRHALPNTSALIVGPFERLRSGAFGPVPSEAQMVVRSIQIKLASEFGFAYFDAYRYLGGEGQMLSMIKKREALSDYTHLTPSGGDRLAQGIYDALIDQYLIYEGRHDEGKEYSISSGYKSQKDLYSYEPKSITDREGGPGAIAFHSMDYAYFLFIVVVGATLLLRYPALRLTFLILASYYFYASWKLWPVSLMLFSTVLDYFCALGIDAARKKATAGAEGRLKPGFVFLFLSLLGNLGLLFFFKYFDFAAGLFNSAMSASGLELTVPALGLLLPVGISFYTFQTLSYTIDVYRGNLPVEKSFGKFSLYVTFFPQLVAGPIVRASEFIPDIQKGIYHFLPDATDFNYGVFQFLGGLLKKMLADWLAFGLIDRVYENSSMFTSAEALIVFYAYGLQIYGDFSGYTDMAMGSARLLGFRLTDNFNRPYQSASISEFWRRWHISLGSWFRDYVYISLGGNRSLVLRNLFITMFLAGLWHGAGLMFIGWGIYHGFFLILERYLGQGKSEGTAPGLGLGSAESFSWTRIPRQILTLHLVLLGWVLFRSHNLDQFVEFFSTIGNMKWAIPNAKPMYIAVVVLAYMYHFSPVAWRERAADLWNRQKLAVQIALTFVLLTGLYQISVQDVQPFIYFQF